MLDFSRSNPYADFGATLTRSYAQAAARTMFAMASQGLVLWAGFLNASLPKVSAAGLPAVVRNDVPPFPHLPQDWLRLLERTNPFFVASDAGTPAIPAPAHQAIVEAASPYSVYRSDGGHAVAQVIMG